MKKTTIFLTLIISTISIMGFSMPNASLSVVQNDNLKPTLGTKMAEALLVCHKTGEQRQGQTKICMYNCAGSAATVTVDWNRQCPVTINK